MSERGRLVRRGKSYVTVTVWGRRSYRVHIRRDEDGLEGYRLERLKQPSSNNTGTNNTRKPPKRRRRRS
jgi:hypothetical protein